MKEPKISVNKLGEYMTASPARRKRIVEDQQEPKTFVVTRNHDARNHIVTYLSENMVDDSKIMSSIQELRTSSGKSDFIEQDRQSSANAIENFLEISDAINIENIIVEAPNSFSSNIIKISGVDVSMRPDVILKNKKSGDIVGCVKLHFPKTNPLNRNGAEYVATAIRRYLEDSNKTSNIDPKKCYVIDIPTKQITTAPKAFKKRMSDIDAACEEINARWKK